MVVGPIKVYSHTLTPCVLSNSRLCFVVLLTVTKLLQVSVCLKSENNSYTSEGGGGGEKGKGGRNDHSPKKGHGLISQTEAGSRARGMGWEWWRRLWEYHWGRIILFRKYVSKRERDTLGRILILTCDLNLRACLHEGEGPHEGEVTSLSI